MRGTFWRDFEDQELIRLRDDGCSTREIAEQIEGRNRGGVQGRLVILRREGLVR